MNLVGKVIDQFTQKEATPVRWPQACETKELEAVSQQSGKSNGAKPFYSLR